MKEFTPADASLLELVDRLLHKGVVLAGEATISVAGNFLMSASDNFNGWSTVPLMSTENVSGSMSSGILARW